MRGKLRDKRATSKRDKIKHELVERRRPSKREANRLLLRLSQQLDDDNELALDEELQADAHQTN